MKKALILLLLVVTLTGLVGCGSRSGQRDNSSDLLPSPCAGCFGEDEKDKMNMKEAVHVS